LVSSVTPGRVRERGEKGEGRREEGEGREKDQEQETHLRACTKERDSEFLSANTDPP
jgi:hypothetical protein